MLSFFTTLYCATRPCLRSSLRAIERSSPRAALQSPRSNQRQPSARITISARREKQRVPLRLPAAVFVERRHVCENCAKHGSSKL
ncbi:hypothetical protein M3J09_000325 [Ascochyta lentis]